MQGEDGITAFLTNSSHVFPAENDGSVTDYSNGGTRIVVYEGATKLTHNTGTLSDGQYKVTIEAGDANNITPGAISTNASNEAVVADPTDPSFTTGDAASIVFTIEIDPASGDSNRFFSREQTFTLAKKGAAGPGSQSVILEADRYVIKYNAQGVEDPSGQQINLTATDSNHTGTVFYEFIVNGISGPNTETPTYTIPDGDEPGPNESVLVKVITREGAVDNPTVATDSISVYGTQDGADGADGEDAITVILTNDSHSFPADSTGFVTDYSGGGNRILVFEGNTKLTHNTGTLSDGQYKVTTANATNISAGTPISTNLDGEAVVPDPGSMTADTASITFNIEVDPLSGLANQNISKQQSFTVSKQGQGGDSPELVKLTADKYIITYDGTGAQDPAGQDINLTATEQNHTGTVYYEFIIDGVSQTRPDDRIPTYTVPDGDEPGPNQSSIIEVNTRESGPSNPVVASDKISIYGTAPGTDGQDGTDAITILVPNEAHTFPAENDGTVTDYSGGGTKIIVYEGNTKLTHNTNTLSDGQYQVTISGNTNISPGTPISTNVDGEAVIPDPSNMSTSELTASILYAVEIDPLSGAANKTFEKQQSFTKSLKGAAGPGSETVYLEADRYVITYDENEVETPSGQSITLTATENNHTGTVYYEFYREGVSLSRPDDTIPTYTVPDGDEPTPNQVITYRVVTRIDGMGNPSVASDSVSVFGVKNGGAGADGGGMVIEVDQTANQNGWYNTNVTWRLVFDSGSFNADYKV